MTQAPETTKPGGPPAHATAGGPPPGAGGPPGGMPDFTAIAERYLTSEQTDFDAIVGLEKEFAIGVKMVMRTLHEQVPYQHELNDAVIKLHLQAVQFAKERDLMDDWNAHDVKTMKPVNERMGQLIAVTGKKELAVLAVAGYSSCHYHMVLETTRSEDGLRRTWISPFKTCLEAGSRIGQFEMTEQWLWENYVIPRFEGYAKDLGVEFEYATWNDATREVWVQVKP